MPHSCLWSCAVCMCLPCQPGPEGHCGESWPAEAPDWAYSTPADVASLDTVSPSEALTNPVRNKQKHTQHKQIFNCNMGSISLDWKKVWTARVQATGNFLLLALVIISLCYIFLCSSQSVISCPFIHPSISLSPSGFVFPAPWCVAGAAVGYSLRSASDTSVLPEAASASVLLLMPEVHKKDKIFSFIVIRCFFVFITSCNFGCVYL